MTPQKIDVAWIDPGHTPGHFTHSIAASVADMEYFGCLGKVHRFGTSMPNLGRNILVRDGFLRGDSEWLWMVDSDMVFDKGHVMKLWQTAMDLDVKMVSGLAFIFKDQEIPIPSYFLEGGPGTPYPAGELHLINAVPDGPMEVAATGLASSLIHREVFENMQAPRHEEYRWFDQITLPGNPTLSGEDTQFFVRARSLGYRLILEPRALTKHLKYVGIGMPEFERHWELREKFAQEEE